MFLKIIDIHEKLLDEGFKIGYTTVRNFVNREGKKLKTATNNDLTVLVVVLMLLSFYLGTF